MTKSFPKLTRDLETSSCRGCLSCPNSDIESMPDTEDGVALEESGWSWDKDEREGVGEGSLITSSVVACLSVDALADRWLVSTLGAEVLTELF